MGAEGAIAIFFDKVLQRKLEERHLQKGFVAWTLLAHIRTPVLSPLAGIFSLTLLLFLFIFIL